MTSDSPCNFDSGKMVVRLKVMLAADKNAVDPVVQNVMQIVKEIECATGKEEAVELALTEALANAVLHGAKADSTKIVECDVACDDQGSMLIIVRDPGNGFDPTAIPSPISGQNLYSNCGRGIYLINQLMDEVKFVKNGSEIQMIKR